MNGKQKTEFRTTKEWKVFRLRLLQERGYQCEICNTIHKKGLNIHHEDEANYTDLSPEKFVGLCRTCHKIIEWAIKKRNFDMEEFTINLKRVYSETVSFRK